LSRLALACLLATMLQAAFAQQTPPAQQPSPTPQDDPAEDVLRVSTSLVQTDVSVVDKKGQFFEGLGREQFELKVDGRVQQVLFLERVTAGSATEAARIAAARGEKIEAGTAASYAERGRTVVFFVDDFHLTPQGIERARELLLKFIDAEMTPGMEVLISSASGQIGFLQQFTNDRAVLRAAARRLKYQSQAALDSERPPMTEFQALAVDRGDQSMLEYLIQQLIFENSPNSFPRNVAENMVRNRARHLRRQSALLSGATISALEGVIRARSSLATGAAGRQTLFYISNGFTFDNQEGDTVRRMQRVIDAAARSGTVVYTLDARGLTVGMEDASSAGVPDLSRESGSPTANAYSAYNASAELSASQEILRGLAADTGGRALLNTNALETAVAKTLGETANYYLLAWRPEGLEANTTGGAPKFRKIEISIKGRPDLNVRVRRGFLDASAARSLRVAVNNTTPNTTTAAAPISTNAALNSALNATGARRELPVDAYPVFTNDAQAGSVINASIQLTNDRLKFAPAAGDSKPQAQVEVVCVVLDDKGKAVYHNGRTLTLGGNNDTSANGAGEKSRGKLVTNFSIPILAPGLYQVRAAARDANSGLLGSAFEWVEVPDLKANRLALSSLLVTERRRANAQTATAANSSPAATPQPPDILRVERRFARSSHALLQLYVYNAARKAANDAPDVELEIKIMRDKRIVMNAPPHKVALTAGSDPARIYYVAEVPLAQMSAGVYLLQVTVTDRATRTTATRELDFAVE
jgi:VWFA-related protein